MSRCVICGADHEDVKEVKVITQSIFDNHLDSLVAGSNDRSSSVLDKGLSYAITRYICEKCASRVFGLYEEDKDFPYPLIKERYPDNITSHDFYFFDIYSQEFFSSSFCIETEYAPFADYLFVNTTFYDYKVSALYTNFNFHEGYFRKRFLECSTPHDYYCPISLATYDHRACIDVTNLGFVSIDAFVSLSKCYVCNSVLPTIHLVRDDDGYYTCKDCIALTSIPDVLADEAAGLEGIGKCNYTKSGYDECVHFIRSVNDKVGSTPTEEEEPYIWHTSPSPARVRFVRRYPFNISISDFS